MPVVYPEMGNNIVIRLILFTGRLLPQMTLLSSTLYPIQESLNLAKRKSCLRACNNF